MKSLECKMGSKTVKAPNALKGGRDVTEPTRWGANDGSKPLANQGMSVT
jgi:hypothetical protein